jgi:hypothetical protein
MTSPTTSLERGKQIPNWIIKDSRGEKHSLWDYRQKSHLVLLFDPDATPDLIKRWLSAIEADKKQWDWLNVKILIVAGVPEDVQPGVYAIDRYGILLNIYPANHWSFDDLEREFLYYEASHC